MRVALLLFGAAALVLSTGVAAAAALFPGGFDPLYTVISKLGSRTQNPVGGLWLSASLLATVCLLWPVCSHLEATEARAGTRPRHAVAALRAGLVAAAALALEGLFALELSRLARKAHELLALAAFLGLYGGVLGLYARRMRRSAAFAGPALLVVLPICAVALSQAALYFDQRKLGWVNTGWRELGVPVWLSFAFWQWLAVACLGIGLGVLVAWRDAPPEN